jgi:hypothetical protein
MLTILLGPDTKAGARWRPISHRTGQFCGVRHPHWVTTLQLPATSVVLPPLDKCASAQVFLLAVQFLGFAEC